MEDQTMIKIERKTVEVLKSLKIVERESYNEVIRRLLDNYLEDSLELNKKSRLKIKKGLEDVKKGRVLSSDAALEYFRKK
ncbi:MAG: ribbon-helix-helix protein, CopG family [Nanoarchaeota archaeon]|jgi:t-SNARE complex subunit (syntaxin)|nr:ribbon-helix-helix protein, CopG family [Nanoarchaeota archaeon]